MSEEPSSPVGALDPRSGSSTLHVVLGFVGVVAAWYVLALAGAVAAYCGYRLLADHDRTIVGGLYAAFGTLAVTFWVGYLLSTV